MITGPYRVEQVPPELSAALARLWTRVVEAGGAVGFVPGTDPAEIAARAAEVTERVRTGKEHLLVLGRDDALAGVVFVEQGERPIFRHRGSVNRLMVDPDLQRQGWGRRLLQAACDHALALGIETLFLATRDGTGLDGFYAANGWVERGRWPGAIRVAPGDDRDEIWFTRDL